MKRIATLLALTFILGACQTVDGNSIDDIKKQTIGYQFIFFSNEKYLEREGNYYDVLLDLKKQYPNEKVNIIIVQSSKNNKLVEHFKVKEYPTLIILKNGKTVTHMAGVHSKDAIRKNILQALGK